MKAEAEDRKVHTTEPDLTESGLVLKHSCTQKGLMFKPLEKSSELPIQYIALCIKVCRMKLEKQ